MSQPTITVREFLSDSYQLISANSPTTTLPGRTQSQALTILNMLLHQYSATGLMLTVEKQIDYMMTIGQENVTFGEANYTPTPDVTSEGRLVLLENAWLTLNGLTYPLIKTKRTEFYSAYKYDPLSSLPTHVILIPGTNLTTLRIFPNPSQPYLLSVFGKFQLNDLTLNTDLSSLPTYYQLYLQYAVARYLAPFTGRVEAWTPMLERLYQELMTDMVAQTPINVDINVNSQSWLNGAYRTIAGV